MRNLPGNVQGVQAPREAPAHLILTIGETAYQVVPTRLEPGDDGRAFRLVKADRIGYEVIADDHGMSCDCPDYRFRHAGRGTPCKHLEALMRLGVIGRPVVAVARRPKGTKEDFDRYHGYTR